ncbi:hypothetical protein LAZ67_9003093 [Cordylochernes scorpioides]|uniref:G-protein coupled receptors family 1 profile domain-containing protein n=1 Tax=Cordylochernes scorpioides TaxID=51811 RepID=A0ABY6KUB2_9ARAC|nr:hypothetical protein LAZ67_9003093 [Cordylochernes scorpioides]
MNRFSTSVCVMCRYPAVHVVASVLAWMSSVINPIIYAALNRQYRHAYLRLCGLVTRRDMSLASSVSRSGSGGYAKTLVSDVFVFHSQSSRGHFQKKPRPDSTNIA